MSDERSRLLGVPATTSSIMMVVTLCSNVVPAPGAHKYG